MMMDSETQALKVHEWLAVTAFIGVLSLLAIMAAHSNPTPSSAILPPHRSQQAEIEVFVEGSVQHPGIYRVKPGTLLKEVLALAQPLENADLRRLKPNSKLRNGRVIKIPKTKPPQSPPRTQRG